jgi:hypothetical protein
MALLILNLLPKLHRPSRFPTRETNPVPTAVGSRMGRQPLRTFCTTDKSHSPVRITSYTPNDVTNKQRARTGGDQVHTSSSASSSVL